MPEYSPRLNIEKALGTENVNRAYFMRVIDQIDKKAATVGADGKVLSGQLPLNDTVNSAKTDEAATANAVKKVNDVLVLHSGDNTRHITAAERTAWDGKQAALPVENRRKITFGTADPTGGVDGDIYFQYE